MNILHLVLFSALVISSLAKPTKQSDDACKPGVNCKLPNCRCWDDPARPGHVKPDFTPQMLILAFSRGLTNSTTGQYLKLIKDLSNPNGCTAKGTFFSEDSDTDVASLVTLRSLGHEIALTPTSKTKPSSKKEWVTDLLESSKKLLEADIAMDEMKGVQGVDNSMGGDDELQALNLLGMKYDGGCVLEDSNSKQSLWPYTFNFVNSLPKCKQGMTPTSAFAGVWEFPVPEMNFRGHKCSTLSNCSPYIESKADAFSLLYNTFEGHFYGGRTPMVINIDSKWVNVDYQVEGLKQFLTTVMRYDKIWLVSMSQALAWIQNPVSMSEHVNPEPWRC